MADLTDVETALGVLIAASLYPQGPSGASPVAGIPVRMELGWPESQELDTAMTAGMGIVSIYAPQGSERNTTRYPSEWQAGPLEPATFTLSASGQIITVGGQGAAYAQNLAVTVNGRPYVAQATGQAPAAIVASLAALISADVAGVTVNGAALTLPATARLGALRVGTGAIASREVRRSERQFQISVWAPSPATRTAIAEGFDSILSDTPFLALADATQARLQYRSSADDDFQQLRRIFRRNLFYTAEYAVTRSQAQTQIVAFREVVTTDQGGPISDTFT